MIIERFGPNLDAVGERFRASGRMMPPDIAYVASWMTSDGAACYQLMEAPSEQALEPWLNAWRDLVDFEVVRVQTSADYWASRA